MLIRSISRGLAGLMLGILLVVTASVVGPQLAFADAAPPTLSGSASSGSGSATATSPADALPDLSNPANAKKALDAEKAAYKIAGWPLALLGAIILLGRGIGQAGKKLAWLAWLNKGAAAVITAGIVTVAIAAFNALAQGGSGYAVLVAAGGAGLALLKPHVAPQPATS